MTTSLPRLSLLALALTLAACGGESDPAPPSSSAPAGGNVQNNTATSTGPEAAATETAPAETDTGAAAPAETDTGAAAPPESQAGAGLEVRIVEFEYMPKDLKVKAGSKLTFTNEDTAAHTATADDRKTFETKDLEKGDTDEVTLDTPGTFTYFCAFHVFMKGSVTVE